MHSHFDLLWNELPRIRDQVTQFDAPNPDDDLMVKFAMVGYAFHRRIDAWGCEESAFVASRRREVADLGPRWVEFVCLASGYLLGLYQAGLCNDSEFAHLEALLPGFMWLHAERFADTAVP